MASTVHGQRVEIDFDAVGEVDRMQLQLAVGARRRGNHRLEVDRGRHAEAAAVVGVLANQIYPPRGAEEPRGGTIRSLVCRSKLFSVQVGSSPCLSYVTNHGTAKYESISPVLEGLEELVDNCLMKSVTRRFFLSSSALTALALRAGLVDAQTPFTGKLLLVGTQTKGTSKGIYAYSFDAVTGDLTRVGLAAATPGPTFLAIAPDKKTIFAVNELEDFGGKKSGAVSSFSLDGATGTLTQVSQKASNGADPCHVAIDATGRSVFAANYTGGSAVSYKVTEQNHLSEPVSFFQYTGHGPNTDRQEGPHAHRVTVAPNNKFLLVNDLGLDLIHIYTLDDATGESCPERAPCVESSCWLGA